MQELEMDSAGKRADAIRRPSSLGRVDLLAGDLALQLGQGFRCGEVLLE